jgi:indoleacetamide hydrolase
MTRQTATQTLLSIRNREISALETTQNLLESAKKSANLGAYIHITEHSATEAARQCDLGDKAARVLNGLPLIVKDNVDVANCPTTAGSKALGTHIPKGSSSVVSRLTDAGAVVLGKANLHEFSLGITSNNGAFGPARNPYDLTRIPGGSSGGTASAVAAGLVPAGIGSDTGGSLRIPAALCGVVGFRPTVGRWPSDGVVRISHTRDTVGPIASSVADCALLDSVVCNEPAELAMIALDKLRIGIPRKEFWDDLDPEMRLAADGVLQLLARNGITLVECDVGFDIDQCNHAGMIIAMLELFDNIKGYLAQHDLPFDAAGIGEKISSPDVKSIYQSLLGADAPPAQAYKDALQVQRPLFQAAYANCFATYKIDALIFPTTPRAAALIGEDDTVELNGRQVPTFPTFARNVGPGSTTGLPGISLPMGLTTQGLPLGIALDGPAGSDRKLLAIAQAIESLLPSIPKPISARH